MSAAEAPAALPSHIIAADQRHLEERALAIWTLAEIRALREAVGAPFEASPMMRLPAGAATWREARDEMLFGFIQRTVLYADPGAPRILTDQSPPHDWFGFAVPGSRMTGNNPDNLYRRAPVDPAMRYALHVRAQAPVPADASIELLPSVAAQVAWEKQRHPPFDLGRLFRERGPEFTVTVDASPADGRTDHLRLLPGGCRLSFRDSMTDWAAQTPFTIEIERTDAPPCQPVGVESLAAQVLSGAHDFVAHWVRFSPEVMFGRPANSFKPPILGKEGRGLITKLNSFGNFALEDDEALVITVEPLEARYMCLALQNCWGQTLEFGARSGSLNKAQAVADADGRYRLVVAMTDPGVHNWLDTSGLGQGGMNMRWQGLPPGPFPSAEDAVAVRKVKASELSAVLPADTATVTPEERRVLLAARAKSYARRYRA